MDTNKEIIHRELAYEVMGAVYEVHNVLGAGFWEKVYERALLSELNIRGIRAEAQKAMSVFYKGEQVGQYIADLVVENKILLELKSVDSLASLHEAQILNYLKATGLRLGILINFGNERVQSKRFAF